MTAAARQSAELRAQIESVHRKMHDGDRCIGIQARELPERGEIAVGDVTYAVVGCASALSVREALLELDESEDARLVVVTSVAEKELGADVLARFARRRLHRVDPWGAVTSLFQAREILGVSGKPDFMIVARYPNSMPQYHVGHLKLVGRIREQVATLPHLLLAGNAYDGVGIPDTIASGEKAAESVFAG